jgi:hypothetical protein
MSITIQLAPHVEAQLREKAASMGQDPAAYVASLVDQDLRPGESTSKTLADMLEGRVGRINSGGKENLSEECGEKFADYLVQKQREGHL